MHPKPWATQEEAWRRHIVQACNLIDGLDEESVAQASSFQVTLTFYLDPARLAASDLDNLAKPVLDTIFLIDRPQTKEHSLTGALIPRNDSAIHRLILEKRAARTLEDCGVDILIEW